MMAPRKKKNGVGWKLQVIGIAALITAVVYAAVSVVMIVGMIPTIVCAIIDRSKGKMKTLTVGAMNFAGCFPFMMEVWKRGGSFDVAIAYILEPRTIVVMYFAAGMGYLIDWAMGGIVSSLMVQKAKSRMKTIREHQADLEKRWGPEVTGKIPMDEYGFAIDTANVQSEEQTTG